MRTGVILAVGFVLVAGCANRQDRIAGIGPQVPFSPETVSINLEHADFAVASQVLAAQPQARIAIEEGGMGRVVAIHGVQWNDDIERIFQDSGLMLTEDPEFTKSLTPVALFAEDGPITCEYQLHTLEAPLYWSWDPPEPGAWQDFPILEMIRSELSDAGTVEYDAEARTITVTDDADRQELIESLIIEEELRARQK